jgi:putative heme-binding domain-containing protein
MRTHSPFTKAFLVLSLMALMASLRAADATPEARPFFLPKNPVAAAYVLGRLSNQELLAAPRSEFVHVALLKRPGLDRKIRVESLKGLAEIRKTSVSAELARGIQELDGKGTDSLPVIRDLGSLLLQQSAEALAPLRSELQSLALEAELPATRPIAYAALASADGGLDPAWELAEKSPTGLADLVAGIPLIRDLELRMQSRPRIEGYLKENGNSDLQRAAILAIGALPGNAAETFVSLASLIKSGVQIDAAVQSLQRLPKTTWPAAEIEPLVTHLVTHLESVPTSDRTETPFLNAVQFTTELTSLLPTQTADPIKKFLRGLGVQVIVLRTVPEQMLYDKTLIVVEAGKPVQVILVNEDAMQHNLVIGTPGSVEELGTLAEKMQTEPDSQGRMYVPDSSSVLHATAMLNSGETARLSFVAPEETGDYIYVCTFPGHWRRMFGTLTVVADLEAYLATAAPPEVPEVHEWTLADLEPDLVKLDADRNLVQGAQLFTNLACAGCHKLGDQGAAFGPDLSDVFERWKGDRAAVLQEILAPSLVVADAYKVTVLETDDGESVSGLVLKEDATSLTIQSGPSEALVQTIAKSGIESRTLQKSSLMPVGLLSTSSREQILDLMAFIKARGVAPAHNH